MKVSVRERKLMLIAYLLAEYELAEVDTLVEWFRADAATRTDRLKNRLLTDGPDDRYVDDFEVIRSVSQLNSDLSIVALWRCIEFCRKRVIQSTLGDDAAREAATHTKAIVKLKEIGISERGVVRWEDVEELRCLNNAIKHGGYVKGPLAKFKAWSGRFGEQISDTNAEYPRLRSSTKEYIKDLTMQASRWLVSSQTPNPQGLPT